MELVVKNASDLRKIYHNNTKKIILPINIANINQTQIKCEQILRLLPKKRLTAITNFNNQEAVIKIFFCAIKARISFLHEYNMHKKLKKISLLTPEILYSGKIGSTFNSIYFLILEKLNQINEKNDCQKINDITSILIKLHKNNMQLNDPHMGNFMTASKGTNIIDTGSIISKKTILTPSEIMNNLIKFVAFAKINNTKYADKIYRNYMSQSNYNIEEKYLNFFRNKYIKFCSYLKNKKVKKIFRCSSNTVVKKFYNKKFIYQRKFDNNNFINFLNNIDEFISSGTILKPGRTCTVAKVTFNNYLFVIKRYNIKNFFHLLKRFFKRSRAATCWANAHTLLFYNIHTPEPIAMIEKKFFFFRHKSYYVTTFVPGINLDLFLNSDINYFTKLDIAKKIKSILFCLRDLHVKHGDTKANNFLVYDDKIYLIDLDSMRAQIKFVYNFTNRYSKDNKRFLKNWQNDIELQKLFYNMGDYSGC